MTTTPTPLVTREALRAFTRQLVECYASKKVILYSCGEAFGYGSLARGVIRSCARHLIMARCCMVEPWSAEVLIRAEVGEDLPGQGFLDFVMPGNGFLHSGGWIDPDGM